jgi:hypothetical protein
LAAVSHNSAVSNIGRATRVCAVCVVFAASALLSGCVGTISGTAVRAQTAGPANVRALSESKLGDVLLSIGDINGIMRSTQMKVTSQLQQMTDHSNDVSDPGCLGAIYGAEDPVYFGSGWTAMRDQVAREPGQNNDHWVEQSAVLYPLPETAQKFFDKSSSTWQKCSGDSVSVDDGNATYQWKIDNATVDDTVVTQMTAQQNTGGWACQHALSVVSNLTVEAWACGYNVKDEAATIANEMIANAAKN